MIHANAVNLCHSKFLYMTPIQVTLTKPHAEEVKRLEIIIAVNPSTHFDIKIMILVLFRLKPEHLSW